MGCPPMRSVAFGGYLIARVITRFFYLFTIFMNNICKLIRFIQILMLIFV